MLKKLLILGAFVFAVFLLVWLSTGANRRSSDPGSNESVPRLRPAARTSTPVQARPVLSPTVPLHTPTPLYHVAFQAAEIPHSQPHPRFGSGIEGYVSARGKMIEGATVHWRVSHDIAHLPPSWSGNPQDPCVQDGPHSDYAAENPWGDPHSRSVRLGGGYQRYDTAIARSFPTEAGRRYRLSLSSRYLHGVREGNRFVKEGEETQHQIAEYGIDLTGQTADGNAPSIEYRSVVDGPNNLWRCFDTEFVARGSRTSVWLRAAQTDAHVGLVWFDGLTVRPADDPSAKTYLLERAREEAGHAQDYLGSAVTGGDGYYRIEGLRAADYDLLAEFPGLSNAQKPRVRVSPGAYTSANLDLFGGGVIRGSVRENWTGNGVAGAVINAVLTPESEKRIAAAGYVREHSVQAGEDGAFALDGLLPGMTYEIVASAEGYVPSANTNAVPDTAPIFLVLTPAGGITGTVVDQDAGTPVSGAFVRLFQNGSRIRVAESDSDGEFALGGTAAGDYVLVADKDGRSSEPESVRLESESHNRFVRLAIPGGAGIEGSVTDLQSGKRVPFLSLELRREIMSEFDPDSPEQVDIDAEAETSEPPAVPPVSHVSRIVFQTDEDGFFVVDGIGVGDWTMAVRGDEYRLAGEETFRVGPEGLRGLVLEVRRNPHINGVIYDDSGNPVAGARVWCRRITPPDGPAYAIDHVGIALSHSDPRGQFTLTVPRAENAYDLVATLDDRLLGWLEGVRVGREPVEISMQPHSSIGGRVTYPDGSPVTGVKVSAGGSVLWGHVWKREGRTDGDGRFLVRPLIAGRYYVRLFDMRTARLLGEYGPVEVAEGEDVGDLSLVMGPR